MNRKKRKPLEEVKTGVSSKPRKKKKIEQTQTIKMSFRKGLKNNDLKEIITVRVLEMSKAIKLASLNVHLHFSDIMKYKSDAEIDEFFKQYVDKIFFNDCFHGVRCIGEENAQNMGYYLHHSIDTFS